MAPGRTLRLRLLTVLIGVLGALCSVTACAAGPANPQHADPTHGAPVHLAPCTTAKANAAPSGGLPDITLDCLGAGPAVDVAALPGPAVVNLWASWCYPCRAEMPLLQKVSEAQRGRVHVLGVDTNDQTGSALTFTKKTVRAGYEELRDSTGKLASALHAPGLPYTIAIDRHGVIVWHHAGKLTGDDITSAINDALHGS